MYIFLSVLAYLFSCVVVASITHIVSDIYKDPRGTEIGLSIATAIWPITLALVLLSYGSKFLMSSWMRVVNKFRTRVQASKWKAKNKIAWEQEQRRVRR